MSTRKGMCASVSLAVAAALWACAVPSAAAQDAPGHRTASFSQPGRPGRLRVQLVSGSIRVRGMTRADVSIVGQPQMPALSVTEENNEMLVSATDTAQRVDLEIVVPMRTSLRLSTGNGGDIVVDNVSGELEVSNTNGSITTTNIAGSIVAKTIGGNIKSAMTRVTADQPLSFTSFSGAVDVTLPFSLRANLRLRSDQGDVFTDFNLQVRPATQTPAEEARRVGGRFRTEANKAIYGTVNGGGPEIELRSFAGNVFLRKGS